MITLDEAIEHAEKMAKIHCVLKNKYNQKCAEEHRQLAEWLKDYKRLLAIESGIDDDLIRRQDALDMVRILQTYKLFEGDDMILVDKADVQTELMMLPSAQPRKRGKWIPDEIAAYDMPKGEPRGWVPWLCSECGWCVGKHQTAFCPSCGADMRDEEDENNVTEKP